MMNRHTEYFRGLLASITEELIVVLRVYADESFTNKAETLCGFIANHDEWAAFDLRWKAVLNDFVAPYFHFKEFADKDNKHHFPQNPFLGWPDSKRDSFINELALVISHSAVPIGGILNIKKFRTEKMEGNPREALIAQFYIHFSQQLNSHWPGFDGRVLFVFDDSDREWRDAVGQVHQKAKELDKRIGGLLFEDDKDFPGLQAASLPANVGFVRFNFSRKFIHAAVLHGEPDAMKHEPSGFLSDAQSAGKLAGANSILRVNNHPESREPLIQPKRAIFKDGANLDGELFLAVPAFPDAASSKERGVTGLAARADSLAILPANRNHKLERAVSVSKILDGLGQRLWKLNCIFHAPTMESLCW